MKMMEFDIEPLVLKSLRAKWRDEIERAIANAKRTAEDKRFRREYYRAGARTGRGWRMARDAGNLGCGGRGPVRATPASADDGPR